MRYLGHSGYCELTRQSLEAVAVLRAGLDSIPGLHVVGDPDINLIVVGDSQDRLREIAAELRRRGWALGIQGDPSRGDERSIHLTVTASHLPVMTDFLTDLAAAADHASRHQRSAPDGPSDTDNGSYS